MKIESSSFGNGSAIPADFAFGKRGDSEAPIALSSNRNPALRWLDPMSHVAFLFMDLHERGLARLAWRFASAYLQQSGDYAGLRVLRYFAVYRALVRAKVAALRLAQRGPSDAEPDRARSELATYVGLAEGFARQRRPLLLLTHGLSGSGKTWASGRWMQAEASGRAIRLRSDVERKRLHGVSPLATSGSGLNEGLYRPQAHEETYASLRTRARMLLHDGWTVVVDAAFLRAGERQAFAELARSEGCPFHVLACEAPPDELRRRIRARQAGGRDASEATLAVLEQQFGWLEPLTEVERERTLPV